MRDATHDNGELPQRVVGLCQPLAPEAAETVNAVRAIEEHVLRLLDELKADADLAPDHRWLASGRTHIETGFMMVNRSVFKPQRVDIPDPATGWVLERADSSPAEPLYYAPEPGGHGAQWSKDHLAALRLSRRIDAVTLREALGVGCRVAEHQWS